MGVTPYPRPPLTSTKRIAFRLRAFSTRGRGKVWNDRQGLCILMKPVWPPLPSWWHDMTLIVYFVTLLWDFSPNGKPKKNTITLQQKKTKRLSLQQNGCRPSRSRATQRFLMRPRAFFGAVSSYGWRRAGHEHRKKRCTFPETRCTNSMRKHKKIRSTHLLTHK